MGLCAKMGDATRMRKGRGKKPKKVSAKGFRTMGGGEHGERWPIATRLVALRNLVAAGGGGEVAGDVKVEKLFQETARYILLLRTQVQILQCLIELHGGGGIGGGGADC